jgi:hypothetical protein
MLGGATHGGGLTPLFGRVLSAQWLAPTSPARADHYVPSTHQPMIGPPPPLHAGSCGGQLGACFVGGDLGTVKVNVGFGVEVGVAGGSTSEGGFGSFELGWGRLVVGLGRVVLGSAVEGSGSRVATGGGSEPIAVSVVGAMTASVVVVVTRAGGAGSGTSLDAVRSTIDAVVDDVEVEVEVWRESAGAT